MRDVRAFLYNHFHLVGGFGFKVFDALCLLAERVKFGVTCIYTQFGGNGTRSDDVRFTEVVAKELETVGLRTRFGLAPARPPWPRRPPPFPKRCWPDI